MTKPVKTKTAAAAEKAVQPTAEELKAAQITANMMKFINGQSEKAVLLSPTQRIIMLVSKVALYAIGFVGSLYITGYLSMVLLNFGMPLFLVAVAEIMSVVLGTIGSFYASERIVDFIVDGGIKRAVDKSGAWVKGLLSRKSMVAKYTQKTAQ